jgi:P-type Cu2+ transporter
MEHHHQEEHTSKTERKSHTHTYHNMNPPMVHAGHDHHAMMISDFKKRFYVVLVMTIMLLSEMIQHWLNLHWEFPGSKYFL